MTVSDKLKIIADANTRLDAGESLKSISRHHNIQPCQLRDWRRNVGRLSRAKKSLKSLHKGFRGRLHAHEEELVAWVLEMRDQGIPLCYKHIVLQAIAMDNAFGELSFESQYHAVRRLCVRNGITIRRVTHTAQADPQDAIDLALQWIGYIRPIVAAPNVGKRWVINMDQSPIWFSMHPKTTLDLRGVATVSGRRTCETGTRFTCTLAISANGDKLRPFLIFKGTKDGDIAIREFPTNPNRVAVDLCCQKSAWQDEDNMLRWIDKALVPYLQEKAQGAPAFLMLDQFSVHWTAGVQQRLGDLGVGCEKIPAGCTGLVQPIDVGVGKPFKDRVRGAWWTSMKEALPNTHVSAKDQRSRAIQWVRDSWDAIPPEAVVRNAWKKGGGYAYFPEENEQQDEEEAEAAEAFVAAAAAANDVAVEEAANAGKDDLFDGDGGGDEDSDEEEDEYEADFEQYLI